MSEDEFVCPLSKVDSMFEYVKAGLEKSEKDKDCPPCLVQPLAGEYLGILEENGLSAQIRQLKKAHETKDVLTIAASMDKIKKEVGEPIKKVLENLDCFTQTFRSE